MGAATGELHGISSAARHIGCAEDTVRDLDRRGIIKPRRDSAGRRQLTDKDIETARAYLSSKRPKTATA
jgi:DNA-binding transcriptional MerR regulator